MNQKLKSNLVADNNMYTTTDANSTRYYGQDLKSQKSVPGRPYANANLDTSDYSNGGQGTISATFPDGHQ